MRLFICNKNKDYRINFLYLIRFGIKSPPKRFFLFSSYSLHSHVIVTSYSLHIHFIFTSYSLHIHFIFTSYSLHIHFIFTSYSLPIPFLCVACLLPVRSQFVLTSGILLSDCALITSHHITIIPL